MTDYLKTKLFLNAKKAIEDRVYEISETLPKSSKDLIQLIKTNTHASIITEIKFSSPSLGEIRKISDPVQIAKAMIKGGAIGLSVLTQPYLFNGSPQFFSEIRKAIDVPLLMKDIIVDKVQIDAAQKLGADYILFIGQLFPDVNELEKLVNYSHKNGLKVIIESHTKTDFERSFETNADIIGINNRNLSTQKINLDTTKELLENKKGEKIILSESGIESPENIRYLSECGADAFLVGSSIMKSDNIEEKVKQLVNAI